MRFIFTIVFSFFAFNAIAGIPSNGLTDFNNVSPVVVASGPYSGFTASNIEGFDFTLKTQLSSATMVIEILDKNFGTGNGVAFYESTSGINPKFSEILIQSNSSARFDLKYIEINARASDGLDAEVTITGLDINGNPVAGASITDIASSSSLTTFDVSLNPAFNGIYSFRITSNDVVNLFLDNISLQTVVSTLPVKWDKFEAVKDLTKVQLNWATSFEQNTANFLIEHSNQQNDWQTIGNVKAAGNSNTQQSYSFIHDHPSNGINSYRIVQEDLDGKRSVSKIVSVKFEESAYISIYPNPAVSNVLNIRTNDKSYIQIFDISGKHIISKTLLPGSTPLDISKFSKGLYFIKTSTQTLNFIKK